MPTRLYLRLAELLLTAALVTTVLFAWRADRRDRAQLAADLAAAKQALSQADTRQHERDAQLLQTLATLAAEKRTVTTPAQIIRDLPNQITLPAPISLQSGSQPGETRSVECGGLAAAFATEPSHRAPGAASQPGPTGKTSTAPDQAVIPVEDLKPLYDFTLDCKACQSKLAAAQGDLADERAKASVLTRERDEAVRAAKGGSLVRRMARAAKWFAIGAAAGAIAVEARR